MSELIEEGGGLRPFARRARVAPATLRNYRDGKVDRPNRLVLEAVAIAGRVKVEWLETGKGVKWLDSSQVASIRDLPKESFQQFFDWWWATADDDRRAWCRIELERIFPDWVEWKKKEAGRSRKRSGA